MGGIYTLFLKGRLSKDKAMIKAIYGSKSDLNFFEIWFLETLSFFRKTFIVLLRDQPTILPKR